MKVLSGIIDYFQVGLFLAIWCPGFLGDAALGGLGGGTASAIKALALGGDPIQAFKTGFVTGAVSGGIYGGIAASESTYERNILFGGVTRSGKQQFLNGMAKTSGAYSQGLNDVILGRNGDFGQGVNGVTRALVNGQELDFSDFAHPTRLPGAGTKSNVYMRPASLKAMASTFGHEIVHVTDIYSGYVRIAGFNLMVRYRNSYGGVNWGNSQEHLRGHLEYRAYQYNIQYGYNISAYLNMINLYSRYAGL